MAAKLKTYRAEIGGAHEWVVAAKSQKDAAAIWGVDLDVFKEGRGGPTTIPALVAAAMEKPGTPMRRVLGGKAKFKPIPKSDVETWKLAAKAMGLTGKPKAAPKKAKAKAASKPKSEPVTKAKAAKPKGPSKAAVAALAKAEKALAVLVAASERAERQAADAMRRLEAKQAAARKVLAEKRAALEAAVSKARARAAG